MYNFIWLFLIKVQKKSISFFSKVKNIYDIIGSYGWSLHICLCFYWKVVNSKFSPFSTTLMMKHFLNKNLFGDRLSTPSRFCFYVKLHVTSYVGFDFLNKTPIMGRSFKAKFDWKQFANTHLQIFNTLFIRWKEDHFELFQKI